MHVIKCNAYYRFRAASGKIHTSWYTNYLSTKSTYLDDTPKYIYRVRIIFSEVIPEK